MGAPTLVDAASVRDLDERAFGGLGCVSHGVVVLEGARSWEARERGYIELPDGCGTFRVGIAYDERKAPYAIDAQGSEQTDLLLSLADEDDYLACAWARVGEGSPLAGVGVDLSARHHFRERAGRRHDLATLLFDDEERALADALAYDDPQLAYATLFAAKEAAFKATAAPLRRWYDTRDEELRFEVRHFVMHEPGIECGLGRNGAAQDAMDAMGIERIVVCSAGVADMALVVGLALVGQA